MIGKKIATLQFEFGEVEVFQHYIITTMKEGITVKPKYNDDLIQIAETYFTNRSFGYITYRKNSYAVDPRIYIETSKIENLVAFAVVNPNDKKIDTTSYEKVFLSKPFEQFEILESAIQWVTKLANGN